MIKRISEERARIDGYKRAVGSAEFFNNRDYDEDFEWLILSYLAEILSSVGRPAPEYAQKLNPPDPDFQTYLAPGIAFQRIEVTEVLRPGYRRGKFHRDLAKAAGVIAIFPIRTRSLGRVSSESSAQNSLSHIRPMHRFLFIMTWPIQSFLITFRGTTVFSPN